MKRYVDIDKFKEQIQHAIDNYNLGFSNGYYLAEDIIEDINYNNFDLANVEEVRHVKWTMAECSEKNGNATCSFCGHWDWSDCKYCSECGAKMNKEKGEFNYEIMDN